MAGLRSIFLLGPGLGFLTGFGVDDAEVEGIAIALDALPTSNFVEFEFLALSFLP